VAIVSELRAVTSLRDFRRLFATRLLAQCADGIFQVSLASFVFFSPEKQTSATDTAIAFATLLLPYSLVGPFAGVLLDRWRRRQVLVVGNLVRVAAVCGVAGLVAAGVRGLPLYAAALAVLSVNRFFLAGLAASLPRVVLDRMLVMANSISTTSGAVATLIGALAGYVVRLLFGEGDGATATTMVVAAAGYLSSAAVAATMDRNLLGPDLDRTGRERLLFALVGVAHGLVQGAKHIWQRRPAARALLVISAGRFGFGVVTIAAILLYRNTFYDDPNRGLGGFAIAFAAVGSGVVAGAVITPKAVARLANARWIPDGKNAWIVTCLAGSAVALLATILPLREWLLVGGAFLIGVAAQGAKICVDTIVQETVDDSFRGRVFSVYDMLFNVSFVSAAAFAAVTLPASGRSPGVIVFVALLYAATAAAYARTAMKTPVTPHEAGNSRSTTRSRWVKVPFSRDREV
jgi:MFS family permease